jgi:hypothetical protein
MATRRQGPTKVAGWLVVGPVAWHNVTRNITSKSASFIYVTVPCFGAVTFLSPFLSGLTSGDFGVLAV